MKRSAFLLALCFLAAFFPFTTAAGPPYAGRTLEDALLDLKQQGLKLIFTTQVVRPDLRVDEEPEAREPRAVLDEILRPHGLVARSSAGGVLVIVAASLGGGESAPLPKPSPGGMRANDEIYVVSNRLPLLGEELSTVVLDTGELGALPHLGDDALRPMTLLPGTSGNDVSAQFSVRGGRQDEVLVVLDGLEILEPFHLKDFGNAFSILAPSTLGGLSLSTGGFSVQYGDRMGGVLEMETLEPDWTRRTELGSSLFEALAMSSGTWKRGNWLGSLRRSLLEIPLAVLEAKENPSYWDGFGKVDFVLGPRTSLRAHGLWALDELDFSRDGDSGAMEAFRTGYESVYGWLEHQRLGRRDRLFQTQVSWSHVDRHRTGEERDETGRLTLRDVRRLDVAALAHRWDFEVSDRHEVMAGFELRDVTIYYDYTNERDLVDPLAVVRDQPRTGTTRFDEQFRGSQWSFYVSDRLHLSDHLRVEAGLRLDSSPILDENHQSSPRINVDYVLGPRSRLRFAWGLFYQTQRLYELQVEDGETRFSGAERSEHRILGYERTFERPGGPWLLRFELYDRRVDNPRVRFENLFDPLSIVPELEGDRVRIAPERSAAHGLEVFLSGQSRLAGRRADWFLSYAYARSLDLIAGREVPRSVDQPHTLRFDLGVDLVRGWRLDLAGELRSGWPTTALLLKPATTDDGSVEYVPVLGPLYGERLPAYRRLDLRLSRLFDVSRGRLEVFFTVQNLTNARNVRGYKFTLVTDQAGAVRLVSKERLWGPAVPNFGVRWKR